nr:hypothetical protein CFP56_07469 [Quercus suber]
MPKLGALVRSESRASGRVISTVRTRNRLVFQHSTKQSTPVVVATRKNRDQGFESPIEEVHRRLPLRIVYDYGATFDPGVYHLAISFRGCQGRRLAGGNGVHWAPFQMLALLRELMLHACILRDLRRPLGTGSSKPWEECHVTGCLSARFTAHGPARAYCSTAFTGHQTSSGEGCNALMHTLSLDALRKPQTLQCLPFVNDSGGPGGSVMDRSGAEGDISLRVPLHRPGAACEGGWADRRATGLLQLDLDLEEHISAVTRSMDSISKQLLDTVGSDHGLIRETIATHDGRPVDGVLYVLGTRRVTRIVMSRAFKLFECEQKQLLQ